MSEKQSGNMKECLVMMPFTEPAGYAQGHFKRVYDYLIKPACEKAGFKAKRVDENAKTSLIVLDILNMILDCEMAICDLSSRNPNVFYELGLRQAFDKKCVLIIDSKTDRPFDTSMLRTTTYDESLRIDLINEKVEELTNAIKETYNNRTSDGNSLVQLLSVKSGAKIPEKREMNEDLSIVLNAIQGLSAKFGTKRQQDSSAGNSFTLPNGDVLSRNEDLFTIRESGLNDRYGHVEDVGSSYVLILEDNGKLSMVRKDDIEFWKDKSIYPF